MSIEEVKEKIFEKLKGEMNEGFLRDYIWMNGLRIKTFSILNPKSGWKVLDIGCGDGWSTIENALVYSDVFFVGIDLYEAEDAEEYAKLFDLKNCKFLEMDALKMDFKGEFDAAFSFLALANICHNKKELEILFKNVFRALKKGGFYLIVDAFQEDFPNFEDLKRLYDFVYSKRKQMNREEMDVIHSLKDVLGVLKNVGFKIEKIGKFDTRLEDKREDILKYFGIKKLPFEMKSFYYYDKPKGLTVILAKTL